ncbi:MAG: imidazole glycerol phosphate synthase subunit HisF [Bdellovibrionota bacterium]|jgi:cyclase
MLIKRIIPCLDIKDGRTVKGVNFVNLIDAGDPVELAKTYVEHGADELVFLDITATLEKRETLRDLVKKIAAEIDIPFIVGGGVQSLEDGIALLEAGANKIGINTAAVKDPAIITALADRFGSKCVVIAIDAKRTSKGWEVYTHGGRNATGKDVIEWAKEAEARGAGEILLTSMDCDGTKQGFDVELTQSVSNACHIPVIASGGAGKKEHFLEVLTKGRADAALAAGIFHFGELSISGLKRYLADENVPVKITPPKNGSLETLEGALNSKFNIADLDFTKGDGLIPAVIQHYKSGEVLMLGYMNQEALLKTLESGKVTFFSRSQNRLWVKGETSSNFLLLKNIFHDCDKDTLLILADPAGPTCHSGSKSCFGEVTFQHPLQFLLSLQELIAERKRNPKEASYTCNLFQKGVPKITEKVGEEAVEVIVAALAQGKEALNGEVSDLLYHLLVLLEEKGITLGDIVSTLQTRHR